MTDIARRLLITTLLVFLLAGLGLSGFWMFGAERLRDNVTQWAATWRAAGNAVAYKPFVVSGFPLYFRARLDEFAIAGGGPSSPWRWQAPTLRLRASPFAPTRARADFSGEHKVVAELFGVPVAFAAATNDGLARVQRRGEQYFAGLEMRGSSLTIDGVSGTFTLKSALINAFHNRRPASANVPSAGLTVALDDLILPSGLLPGPLGALVDALNLEAEVMGAIGPQINTASVAAWRDAGGTVEVETFTLRWGPLRLRAEGTVALDGQLQPLAAFTATMTGYGETIDLLVTQGALDADDAVAAKTLLSLLAKTPLTGGAPEIAVPLTIQNQRLSVGPVPLFTLRPIVWPAT
ncbi:MAG: DUF2125 domain-containing protein [Alphaproteobacteria bacterium]